MSKQTSLASFFKSTKKEVAVEKIVVKSAPATSPKNEDSIIEEPCLSSQLSSQLNIKTPDKSPMKIEKTGDNSPSKDENKKDMLIEEQKTTKTKTTLTLTEHLVGAKSPVAQEEQKLEQHPNSTGDMPQFDDFVNGLCSWQEALKKTTSQKYFSNLYSFLKKEYRTKVIFPPPQLIFNAFKQTPITNIKVVIIGQDPYHQPKQAMGLSFSVPPGVTVPSSLRNIYKSLLADQAIPEFNTIPKTGDLTCWAKQGVFLLNTILTVEYDKPLSHKKAGWETFTDEVVAVINKECENIVFLAWGVPAQQKVKYVNRTKHLVLETSHPSGYSYDKGFDKAFHFSKANEYLVKVGKTPIDWRVPS